TNGLNSYLLIGEAEQRDQQTGQVQQVISVQANFIAYNGNIYMLMGMSLKQDFARYQRTFEQSMSSFRQLTDSRYLNRLPERLRIATNNNTRTLSAALSAEGIPRDRLEEFSVLNGMPLNAQLERGMLFKALQRQ
ncbi:MAG: peptidase M48, partial [Bacteroidota bacterium]